MLQVPFQGCRFHTSIRNNSIYLKFWNDLIVSFPKIKSTGVRNVNNVFSKSNQTETI